MSDFFRESVNAIIDHLIDAARNDTALRNRLIHIAEEILARTASELLPPNPAEANVATLVDSDTTETPRETDAAETVVSPDRNGADHAKPDTATLDHSVSTHAAARPDTAELVKALTLGKSTPSNRPLITLPQKYQARFEINLETVQRRCWLKAEAARWAAKRQRMIAHGADFTTEIAPGDRDIVSRARKLRDCYLWMCDPYTPIEKMVDRLETVAGCYDTLAAAIERVRHQTVQKVPTKGELQAALKLMAEAKCALATIISELNTVKEDKDQSEAHLWLASTSRIEKVFIDRFMKLNDRADPENWPDLLERIESADAKPPPPAENPGNFKKLLARVKYKISQADTGRLNWASLVSDIETLIANGLPASNATLREILLPHFEDIPDDVEITPGFVLVIREMDRFLANQVEPEPDRVTESSKEVLEAAKLLKGKSLLLIGGEFRPLSHKALAEAFELEELIWFSVREHESNTIFEPSIMRPDVVAVLLAIRWSSHSYGDVKALCDQFGKPLIRLPGGYNPNQVAVQILSQASHRLSES